MEKKKMKLWKKLLLILLALLLVFIILTLRKYLIITKLINASKSYVAKTNFMVDTYALTNDSVTTTKTYHNGENFLTRYKTYRNNASEMRSLIIYNKDNEKICIIESDQDKVALLNGNIAIGPTGINTINEFDDIKLKIPLAFTSKIKSQECNGKDCYLIELSKDDKIWVEKETGIIIRNMSVGYITNRNYTFDVVKDEDIIKPDISDCKIQENI